MLKPPSQNVRKRMAYGIRAAALFAVSLSLSLGCLWLAVPPSLSSSISISGVDSLEKVKLSADSLARFRRENEFAVLRLVTVVYVLKQAWSIPGSALLNLLLGHVYGVAIALPLVCFLNACGASLNYILSQLIFANTPAIAYLDSKLTTLKSRISSAATSRKRLLWILISIRVVPFLPNWLLNSASPHLGIPLSIHFFSVLIGLLPYNLITVQAGELLGDNRLESWDDVLRPDVMLKLLILGVVLLGLGLVRRGESRSAASAISSDHGDVSESKVDATQESRSKKET